MDYDLIDETPRPRIKRFDPKSRYDYCKLMASITGKPVGAFLNWTKAWEGSKGTRNHKLIKRNMRNQLNILALPLMENQQQLVVGDYILEKWYDPPSDKTRVMIYTKESWNKRENYRKNENNLDWIK